jgi:hypothetical protein
MVYLVETNNFGHENFFDIFENSVSAAILLTFQVSGNAFNIGFSVFGVGLVWWQIRIALADIYKETYYVYLRIYSNLLIYTKIGADLHKILTIV